MSWIHTNMLIDICSSSGSQKKCEVVQSVPEDKVENVEIRLKLSNGCVGWGESPVLLFVTAEDQTTTLSMAAYACSVLQNTPPVTLSSALQKIYSILPGQQFAYVRDGVEMALIDAVAKSIVVPL